MAAEIDEALTAAGVTALVQKTIDPMLLEYQRRYSPLLRVTPTKKISSTSYYFNRRTFRAPGGFVTDGGARPQGNSVYEQFSFDIRLLQSVGGVTGYAQEVTRDQIGDLRGQEIASCMQGLLWDMETAMIWGSSGATKNGPWPQYDGLDVMVNQFTGTPSAAQNAIDAGGNGLTLGLLDQLIDMVETNAAMPVFNDHWMFVTSSTGVTKVGQLNQQYLRYSNEIEIASGLLVSSYRGIPLVKSSFLSSRIASALGTVTATPGASGGSLGAGTYYYVIEPIFSRAGSGRATTEVSATTTGSTGTVTLSFAVPTGAEGSAPISYRVYRSTATGQETLLGIVDSVVATQGDGITPIYATSIIDNGTSLNVAAAGPVYAPIPNTSYIGGSSQKPRVLGGEDIYLVPRDPDVLVRPYVRDITPLTIYPTVASPDQLPFALATDTTLALRAPKYVGRMRNVNTTLSS